MQRESLTEGTVPLPELVALTARLTAGGRDAVSIRTTDLEATLRSFAVVRVPLDARVK